MQVTRDSIKQEIDHLDNAQLAQLADYIAFLKFRSRFQQHTPNMAHLGPNSDEAAAIGYKKKSEYKRRRRPVKASA